MILKQYLYIPFYVFALLWIVACSPTVADDAEEDYEKLFPFKGIEKPKISYDDQAIQLASIDMNENTYIYPGVEINAEKRTYNVTLKCTFFEKDINDELEADDDVSAQYVIRYIDADKKLKTILSKLDGAYDEDQVKMLKNGQELTVNFQAQSGFPMLLLVKGGGPRLSSVKANISAVSTDGFTIVRPLIVEEYQNEEGVNPIKNPFCGYIILP